MKKLLDWFERNIGVVIIIMIAIIILAPSFFSGSTFTWLENCFLLRNVDFSNTGNIGDTIGGITAPFIGVLSIILLYITFREQRRFNKAQKLSDDWKILSEMQGVINKRIEDVEFDMIWPNRASRGGSILGFWNIGMINTDKQPNHKVSSHELEKLRAEFTQISILCTLFDDINNQSSLPNEMKESFRNAVRNYSDNIERFFELSLVRNLPVD